MEFLYTAFVESSADLKSVALGTPKIERLPDTEVDASKPGKKSVNEMLAEMRMGNTGEEAAEAGTA